MDGRLDESADPSMPTSTKKSRRRRKPGTAMDGNLDKSTDLSMPTSTKKRRHKRKHETILLPAEIAALGVPSSFDNKSQNPNNENGDNSSAGLGIDSLIGQTVHGILDGSFPAGYLITVKIGGSDTLLKGAVFGPGVKMPRPQINVNLAATKVKHEITDMNPGFSSQPSSPPPRTPVTLSEVYEPAPVIKTTAKPEVYEPVPVINTTAKPTVVTEVEIASENKPENLRLHQQHEFLGGENAHNEDLRLPQQHGFLGGENDVSEMLESVTQDYKLETATQNYKLEICDPVAAMQAALYNRVELVQNYTYTPLQPE